jgi:hypothetical protein
MLFLLVIKPLHLLFRRAQEMQLLEKLSLQCDNISMSLYADDVAIFIKPTT